MTLKKKTKLGLERRRLNQLSARREPVHSLSSQMAARRRELPLSSSKRLTRRQLLPRRSLLFQAMTHLILKTAAKTKSLKVRL